MIFSRRSENPKLPCNCNETTSSLIELDFTTQLKTNDLSSKLATFLLEIFVGLYPPNQDHHPINLGIIKPNKNQPKLS